MQRTIEGGGRAGQRRIRVGMRAADAAHGAGRAVLLVVGVQDEEHVERALEHGVRRVLQLGHLEQHVQEVASEAEVVVGLDVWAPDAVPVGVGRNRGRLGDEPQHLQLAPCGVVDRLAVLVEGRHRRHRAHEHAHRMRVVVEALDELLDVLMHHRVHGHLMLPVLQLGRRRQLAVQQQVRRLEVGAVLGQLLDGIAPILEHADVAVDEGDAAAARRGVHERRVVGQQTGVVGCIGLDLLEISGLDRTIGDGKIVRLARAVVGDCERVSHGVNPPHCSPGASCWRHQNGGVIHDRNA